MDALMTLLLAVPANLWAGYALSVMWEWYVEPLGAPHLSIVRAIGVFFVVGLFRPTNAPTHKPVGEEYTTRERLAINALTWTLAPALTLLFGWIWHHWL